MLTESVVYQSLVDPVSNEPLQQLSNLQLTGLSTLETNLNTDPNNTGGLYASYTKSGATYLLDIYKDSAQTQLVAHATNTALGVQNVISDNSSGITGTVNFAFYASNDTNVKIIAFLSRDIDLQLDNLTTIPDYDQTVGFAYFHLLAMKYITREYLVSKFQSQLWNSTFVDQNQINNVVGGFDLSRILNLWTLREASAAYALSRICEKQAVNGDGLFAQKTKEYKIILKAMLQNIDIQFDNRQSRVPSYTRAMSVLKMSRC